MSAEELLNKCEWRMKMINRIRSRRVYLTRKRMMKKAFLEGKIKWRE